MLKITYFNRDKRPGNFSIEELFRNIQNELKGKIAIHNYTLSGKGGRLKGIFEVKKYEGEVNHITGDVNFLAIGLKGNKTIITVHDIGYYENLKGLSIKNIIYKWVWFKIPLLKAKYITTVSHYTKAKILQNFNIPSDKIIVVHNPVNPLFKYQGKKFNSSKPVIMQIGTGKHKNLMGLVKAVANLNCKIVIVGKPSEEDKIYMESNNVDHEIDFNITEEALYQKYIQADILFFASFHEGFGVPIIEANAMGIPVITSNCCSMPEVGGDAALYVNPASIEEIKIAIHSICSDARLRDNLVKRGFENVQRFSISSIAKQYLSIYNKITQATKR